MNANRISASTSAPHIVVMPTTAAYVDQLQTLEYIGYNLPVDSDDYVITADMFRHHLRVFPEGQFMAIDVDTDTVVGLTVSMRLAFDATRPKLDTWFKTTGYG